MQHTCELGPLVTGLVVPLGPLMQGILKTPGPTVAGNLEHGRVKVVPEERGILSGHEPEAGISKNYSTKNSGSPEVLSMDLGGLT